MKYGAMSVMLMEIFTLDRWLLMSDRGIGDRFLGVKLTWAFKETNWICIYSLGPKLTQKEKASGTPVFAFFAPDSGCNVTSCSSTINLFSNRLHS